MRHQVGRVVAHGGLQRVKAIGVRSDVGGVRPAFPQHDVQQAVEQHDVGAGLDGQVQICDSRSVGLAGVAENDFESGVGLLCVFNAPEQNRVGIGRVAADDEDARGVVHVVIAIGRCVGPQRLLVASHCAAHAQA